MHDLSPLIVDLAIILCMGGAISLLFRALRIPVVMGYLLTGALLSSNFTESSIIHDKGTIRTFAELGVIFLMFSLGLEFSFRKLQQVSVTASVTGVVEVMLMIMTGLTLGHLFGWNFQHRIFLAGAMAISSTTLIIRSIDDLGFKLRGFAQTVFGLLIVEDLLAILVIVGLSSIVTTESFSPIILLSAILKLGLVIGSWFLIGYFLIPSFMRLTRRYITKENLILTSVGLCLLLVVVASKFNYSAALGAFIMGSILAESDEVTMIEQLIDPLRSIFVSIFFISVGMLIEPSAILGNYVEILVITAVIIFGKMIYCSLGMLMTGQSLRTSLQAGMSMAQIGEFSFIIASIGVQMQAIDRRFYSMIVISSALTAAITPILMRQSDRLALHVEKVLPASIHELLDRYHKRLRRLLLDSLNLKPAKKMFFRIGVNAIVVALIFIAGNRILLPNLYKLFSSPILCELGAWTLSVVCASPFVWAMIWLPVASEKKDLVEASFGPRLFGAVIASAEVGILSAGMFFKSPLFLVLTVSIGFALLVISYRRFDKTYRWFESKLVDGLSPKERVTAEMQQRLRPWEAQLVRVTIDRSASIVGKRLDQLAARQRFGINIVMIQRGYTSIMTPSSSEVIMPLDELLVVGLEDQVNDFVQYADRRIPPREGSDAQFHLVSRLLDSKSSLLGKRISESRIKDDRGLMIVGVDRKGTRTINPDPHMVLQVGDYLLMVGRAGKEG